jgi:hypothetical protein
MWQNRNKANVKWRVVGAVTGWREGRGENIASSEESRINREFLVLSVSAWEDDGALSW